MNIENKISVTITEEDQTKIDTSLNDLDTIFMYYLTTLSNDEKQAMPLMGKNTLSFVEDSHRLMIQNPALTPSYVDTAEMGIDLEAVKTLTSFLNIIDKIKAALEDSIMLSGSEAYTAALAFYHSIKGAAKANVPNTKVIYDELRTQFARKNKTVTEDN